MDASLSALIHLESILLQTPFLSAENSFTASSDANKTAESAGEAVKTTIKAMVIAILKQRVLELVYKSALIR